MCGQLSYTPRSLDALNVMPVMLVPPCPWLPEPGQGERYDVHETTKSMKSVESVEISKSVGHLGNPSVDRVAEDTRSCHEVGYMTHQGGGAQGRVRE